MMKSSLSGRAGEDIIMIMAAHHPRPRRMMSDGDWSEGKGDAVLRRTALRFEGVASPPVRVCAGPILHIANVRP